MSERRVAAACAAGAPRARRRAIDRFVGCVVPALSVAALLVAAPARAASIDRGQQLYSAYCANCHGQNGTPIWPGTPDFKRSTSLVRSNSQLLAVIRQGKGAMPAYLGIIKEREMLDVIAYLRTMN